MRKICLLAMMPFMLMAGCAGSPALIKESSTSTRTGIFQMLPNGGTAPKGATDVVVSATVKTHVPGSHWASDSHGTGDFRLILNIDGQALVLRGAPQPESTEATTLPDPEAGVGKRYRFDAKLRLSPGTHRIVVASPEDQVATERKVTLSEGGAHALVIEPIYSGEMRRVSPYTSRTFKSGISGIRLILDGREV